MKIFRKDIKTGEKIVLVLALTLLVTTAICRTLFEHTTDTKIRQLLLTIGLRSFMGWWILAIGYTIYRTVVYRHTKPLRMLYYTGIGAIILFIAVIVSAFIPGLLSKVVYFGGIVISLILVVYDLIRIYRTRVSKRSGEQV